MPKDANPSAGAQFPSPWLLFAGFAASCVGSVVFPHSSPFAPRKRPLLRNTYIRHPFAPLNVSPLQSSSLITVGLYTHHVHFSQSIATLVHHATMATSCSRAALRLLTSILFFLSITHAIALPKVPRSDDLEVRSPVAQSLDNEPLAIAGPQIPGNTPYEIPVTIPAEESDENASFFKNLGTYISKFLHSLFVSSGGNPSANAVSSSNALVVTVFVSASVPLPPRPTRITRRPLPSLPSLPAITPISLPDVWILPAIPSGEHLTDNVTLPSIPTIDFPFPTPTDIVISEFPLPELSLTLPELPLTLPELPLTLPELPLTLPELSLRVPKPTRTITLPQPTLTLPDPTITLPEPTATLPEATLTLPEPTSTLTLYDWPTLGLPELSLTLPDLSLGLPEPTFSLPDLSLDFPEPTFTLPVFTPPELSIDFPEPTLTPPSLSLGLPEIVLTIPDLSLELPEPTLTLPELSLELPAITVTVPELSLDFPEPTLAPPELSFELPEPTLPVIEISVDFPEQTLTTPDLSLDFPEPTLAPPELSLQFPDLSLTLASPELSLDFPVPTVVPPELSLQFPDLSLTFASPELSLDFPVPTVVPPGLSLQFPEPSLAPLPVVTVPFDGSLSLLSVPPLVLPTLVLPTTRPLILTNPLQPTRFRTLTIFPTPASAVPTDLVAPISLATLPPLNPLFPPFTPIIPEASLVIPTFTPRFPDTSIAFPPFTPIIAIPSFALPTFPPVIAPTSVATPTFSTLISVPSPDTEPLLSTTFSASAEIGGSAISRLRSICEDPNIKSVSLPIIDRFYGPSSYPSLFPFPGCTVPTPSQELRAPGLLNCTTLGSEVQRCQQNGRRVLISVKLDSPSAVGGDLRYGLPTFPSALPLTLPTLPLTLPTTLPSGLDLPSSLATLVSALEPLLGIRPSPSPLPSTVVPNLFDATHHATSFALTLFSLFGEGLTERPDLRPLGEGVTVDGFDVKIPSAWKGTFQDGELQKFLGRLGELNSDAWQQSGATLGGLGDLGNNGKPVVLFGWL